MDNKENPNKSTGLKKELSFLEIFIAGVVGAVGTGVLFSTAGMAGYAGPSLIISWIIGALFYTFIAIPIIELSLVWPEA
ncbi:MAG: hypothetical protein RAK17_05475 [Caldisphaera sp.]|nr:hypothetical protein [Caldisphaera sp.]